MRSSDALVFQQSDRYVRNRIETRFAHCTTCGQRFIPALLRQMADINPLAVRQEGAACVQILEVLDVELDRGIAC